MCRAICSPISACIRISACSASVSGPGLARTRSGIAILPMSCSRPASRQRAVKPGDSPSRSAIRPDSSPTCSACSGGIPSRRLADSASAVASAPPSGSSCCASTSRTSLASRVWLRPRRLAAYSAWSTATRIDSRSGCPASSRAAPTEAVTCSVWPPISNGWSAIAWRIVSPIRRSARSSGASLGEHDELLAAPAGQDVVAPDATAQPLGDLDQRRVAAGVAVGVVDPLEAVDVEQQHPGRAAVVRRRGQHRVQLLCEVAPVRDAGQLVGARAALGLVAGQGELVRGEAALGDVRDDAVEEQPAAVVAAGPVAVPHPARAAVVAHDPVLDLAVARALPDLGRGRARDRRDGSRRPSSRGRPPGVRSGRASRPGRGPGRPAAGAAPRPARRCRSSGRRPRRSRRAARSPRRARSAWCGARSRRPRSRRRSGARPRGGATTSAPRPRSWSRRRAACGSASRRARRPGAARRRRGRRRGLRRGRRRATRSRDPRRAAAAAPGSAPPPDRCSAPRSGRRRAARRCRCARRGPPRSARGRRSPGGGAVARAGRGQLELQLARPEAPSQRRVERHRLACQQALELGRCRRARGRASSAACRRTSRSRLRAHAARACWSVRRAASRRWSRAASSSRQATSACTTSGSKWLPAQRRISSIASSRERPCP